MVRVRQVDKAADGAANPGVPAPVEEDAQEAPVPAPKRRWTSRWAEERRRGNEGGDEEAAGSPAGAGAAAMGSGFQAGTPGPDVDDENARDEEQEPAAFLLVPQTARQGKAKRAAQEDQPGTPGTTGHEGDLAIVGARPKKRRDSPAGPAWVGPHPSWPHAGGASRQSDVLGDEGAHQSGLDEALWPAGAAPAAEVVAGATALADQMMRSQRRAAQKSPHVTRSSRTTDSFFEVKWEARPGQPALWIARAWLRTWDGKTKRVEVGRSENALEAASDRDLAVVSLGCIDMPKLNLGADKHSLTDGEGYLGGLVERYPDVFSMDMLPAAFENALRHGARNDLPPHHPQYRPMRAAAVRLGQTAGRRGGLGTQREARATGAETAAFHAQQQQQQQPAHGLPPFLLGGAFTPTGHPGLYLGAQGSGPHLASPQSSPNRRSGAALTGSDGDGSPYTGDSGGRGVRKMQGGVGQAFLAYPTQQGSISPARAPRAGTGGGGELTGRDGPFGCALPAPSGPRSAPVSARPAHAARTKPRDRAVNRGDTGVAAVAGTVPIAVAEGARLISALQQLQQQGSPPVLPATQAPPSAPVATAGLQGLATRQAKHVPTHVHGNVPESMSDMLAPGWPGTPEQMAAVAHVHMGSDAAHVEPTSHMAHVHPMPHVTHVQSTPLERMQQVAEKMKAAVRNAALQQMVAPNVPAAATAPLARPQGGASAAVTQDGRDAITVINLISDSEEEGEDGMAAPQGGQGLPMRGGAAAAGGGLLPSQPVAERLATPAAGMALMPAGGQGGGGQSPGEEYPGDALAPAGGNAPHAKIHRLPL